MKANSHIQMQYCFYSNTGAGVADNCSSGLQERGPFVFLSFSVTKCGLFALISSREINIRYERISMVLQIFHNLYWSKLLLKCNCWEFAVM